MTVAETDGARAAAAAAPATAAAPAKSQAELEAALSKMLTGATLEGSFTHTGGRAAYHAAETLKEDLESKGPVRVSEVEAEQREILKVVRRLADEGQIQVGANGSDDAFI